MRIIRRSFTLILTLAVLLAGFTFPEVQGNANAETVTPTGIAGTSDVGVQPDELLQSGEWLYYLDGDEAIIAGYVNEDEQTITVPYQLNKHYVSGIGDDAFHNNAKLSSIFIHSMITKISDSAFSYNSAIEIDAYCGSYALQYADTHGIKSKNLTNPLDVFYINSWIVDFSGFSHSEYTIGSNYVSISKKLATILEVGQFVLIPEYGHNSNPYIRLISKISPYSDQFVLGLDSIDENDYIFNRICFPKQDLFIDSQNVRILSDGVELIDSVSSSWNNININEISFFLNKTIPLDKDFLGFISVNGIITIRIDCNASVDISHPFLGIYYVENADMYVRTTTSSDVTVTVNNSKSSNSSLTAKKEWTIASIPLIPGYTGFSDGKDNAIGLIATIKAQLTASGSIRIVVDTAQSDYHISCRNKKWNWWKEKQKSGEPYFEGTINAEFSIPIELYFGVEGKLGDLAGISFKYAYVQVAPTLSITGTSILRTAPNIKCFDGRVNLDIKFSAFLGKQLDVNVLFWELEWSSKKSTKFEYTIPVCELFRIHIDAVGGRLYVGDKCYVHNRKVIYQFDNGYTDITQMVDAGEILWKPNTPEKSGYEFAGWGICFNGTDFDTTLRRIELESDRLPYMPLEGVYYIKALWKKPGDLDINIESISSDPITPDPTQPGGTTRHPEPPKPIKVSSITLNKTDEILHVDGQYKDKLYLSASVYPANATNTSVTWSSSNPAVASVDNSGVVSALTEGETIITCKSNMVPSVTATCKVTVFQPIYVKSITLDKTSAELWANESDKCTLQLKATVDPTNATYSSVHWSSSNENVAWVDGWGKVTGLSAGTATIKCQSIKNQDVIATCQITVHQHVQNVFITAERQGILPSETVQLSALCYPTNADNKKVAWSSSDASIASVDAKGLVTARKYGTATITATASDGAKAAGNYEVSVERELTLNGDVQNSKLYLDGGNSVVIGYAYATQGSVRRMIERGYDLEWKLLNGSNAVADAYIDVVPTIYTVNGKEHSIPSAVLYSGELHKAGTATFTLQCKAGSYTATVDLKTTVSGEKLAKSVKLNPSKFELGINEVARIPITPLSADGGVVPKILSVSISGDRYYCSHAHESGDADGRYVWFPESGQYTAKVVYKAANTTYTVPVTFEVRDENGIMHLPVTSVALSDSFVNMVVGDTYQLSAKVSPTDAYDRSVTWASDDTSIATVSKNGKVTAKKRGMAYIRCEANDGSGCYDSCVLNVEPFMALNETSIEKTIYMDGETNTAIDSCSLTYQSALRIEEKGLTPNWTLKRVSGDATEIALYEFTSTAEGNVRIEGEEIQLLRANHTGTDRYRLTCEAGSYSASCDITLKVVKSGNLPKSIALVTNHYEATIGETVEIDTSIVCTPSTAKLPDDANITMEPSKAFWNAMEENTYFGDFSCTFAEAGEYTAELVYSGANYRYAVPFTVRVKDENGNVPVAIQDIVMSKESVQLLVGDTAQLSATVRPSNADYGSLTWSSFDTSIATVSTSGKVTAMGAGITYIIASSSKSDRSAICLVTVEDGLTLESDALTKTIFVDGATRTTLDTVFLTESSSKRLTSAPEWSLQRVSGNNLTLRATSAESVSDSGDTLYGCRLILHSASSEGQTVYNLVCSHGNERATMRIVVNAVSREGNIPASISISPTSYEAGINELIVVSPAVTCWPEGTRLPEGTRVEFSGDKQFIEAVNPLDWNVSQSISTFSFKTAGRYEANCVYSYSNISYTIPITFYIKDSSGNVPVHGKKMTLNTTSLQMVAGEESQLEAVFTPADVTNNSVTWASSDTDVATVDAAGHVKAKANGSAQITCTPADKHCSAVICYVTVEDYLTVETGSASYSCYLEGDQKNLLSSAWLTSGTVNRLNRDGIKPVWTLTTTSGSSATVAGTPDSDGSAIRVSTVSLTSEGTTEYRILCTAGKYKWTHDYKVVVSKAGIQAPKRVTLATPVVNLDVGKTKTINFAPVCEPAGTSLPQNAVSTYVGIGGFYDGLDRSVYKRNGDNVTVAFTKPGRYLLARNYKTRNLDYTALCVINVGSNNSDGYGLLKATEHECVVYMNGTSGAVSDLSINDAMVYDRFGRELEWSVERLSGNSVTAGLIPKEDTATLYVASADKEGKDVWRVSCSFGGITEYMDISIEVKKARKAIPDSIELSTQRVTGMTGDWLYLPLGVKCNPEGSALPETGDDFWTLKMLGGLAEELSESKIENGMLAICFSESGYYTGTLTYASGNVSFSVPVYFTICDEESQIDAPDQLKVWVLADSNTVYPEGETGVAIATAVIAENLNSYYAGTAPSYVSEKGAKWSVSITSGNAVTLGIQRNTANTADILLKSITGSGDVKFKVSCVVDGKTYTETGTLHAATNSEARPDVTLIKSRYQVTQGTPALISRMLYQRSNGSMLQSAGEWNLRSALSAIGYSYETTDEDWNVTFYKQGEYTTTVSTYVGNLRYDLPLIITVVGQDVEETLRTLKLPAALTLIDEEAFSGLTMQVVDLRGTKVKTIKSNAFRNCVDLVAIYIPSSVTGIATNAFYGCLNLTIHCEKGSSADKFAASNGFAVSYDMK